MNPEVWQYCLKIISDLDSFSDLLSRLPTRQHHSVRNVKRIDKSQASYYQSNQMKGVPNTEIVTLDVCSLGTAFFLSFPLNRC